MASSSRCATLDCTETLNWSDHCIVPVPSISGALSSGMLDRPEHAGQSARAVYNSRSAGGRRNYERRLRSPAWPRHDLPNLCELRSGPPLHCCKRSFLPLITVKRKRMRTERPVKLAVKTPPSYGGGAGREGRGAGLGARIRHVYRRGGEGRVEVTAEWTFCSRSRDVRVMD